jgi:hypothetical protein
VLWPTFRPSLHLVRALYILSTRPNQTPFHACPNNERCTYSRPLLHKSSACGIITTFVFLMHYSSIAVVYCDQICLVMLYSLFWLVPRRLNFICRTFGTPCSIFIGCVSRRDNRYENIGVFIREEVWLENSLSQSEGGVTVRGRVRVQK